MTGAGKDIVSVQFPDFGSPDLLTAGTMRRLRQVVAVPCCGLLPAMF